MTRYADHVSTRRTPQNEQADPKQVKNSAGGFAFQVDDWMRLDRFLVLGSEGGSYYAKEKALTKENAAVVQRCLDKDGPRTVARIVDISQKGRAPKNDPAIFALAMASGHKYPLTRATALAALPLVCRTGTHLFQFLASAKAFRGWGRGLRNAVMRWYVQQDPQKLAYQVVKYQQRGGYSHRDVLRLAGGALKDIPHSEAHRGVFRWIVAGPQWAERIVVRKAGGEQRAVYPAVQLAEVPKLIFAFETIKSAHDYRTVRDLITMHRLTHEMVPNEFKNDASVWEALLPHMPVTATLRNLGKMTAVGLLAPFASANTTVIDRLTNVDTLRKGRVHPLSILVALNTYARGKGVKGKLSWNPVPQIIDALDEAFYLSFGAIEPTGKRRLIALDVSGSMGGPEIAGMAGITPRVGSAAMAMTTVRTEAHYQVIGFTGSMSRYGGGSSPISVLGISKKTRLDDLVQAIDRLPFGGTDCSLPMQWAEHNGIDVDAIEIYTDNETWAGSIHPHQALRSYREKRGHDCKLTVVGMVSNGFTIADPSDPGMLDVVGFDTATPNVISSFIKEGFTS